MKVLAAFLRKLAVSAESFYNPAIGWARKAPLAQTLYVQCPNGTGLIEVNLLSLVQIGPGRWYADPAASAYTRELPYQNPYRL